MGRAFLHTCTWIGCLGDSLWGAASRYLEQHLAVEFRLVSTSVPSVLVPAAQLFLLFLLLLALTSLDPALGF